jgi:hypothetical protein
MGYKVFAVVVRDSADLARDVCYELKKAVGSARIVSDKFYGMVRHRYYLKEDRRAIK